jgi:hypothetical protein
MSEQVKELEGELEQFKLALMNAKAIEQTYLRFGTVFDELFQKIALVERKITQVEVQVAQNKNLIVQALQEKYRGGTS